ncbi:sugar ABC transporter permease [Thiospirochaeta perfilievii]|uniref:Sugar ABC transporter permease n=1 Tax=Thiospirochaeta perfilievii TaxID=252967 RepID=A0A5C1QDL5_9SPIO|nr:sugar ABC transporter permease [Thiospirochaeta perfilievii]QEN04292.1 sugar ABC transporter permease [Thiospirochaeta perfilievii]
MKKQYLAKRLSVRRSNDEKVWILLFLLPTLVFYGLFVVWPLLASLYYSFFQWDGFTPKPSYFIGFRNYIDVLQDEYFWNAGKNTLVFVLGNNLVKLPLTLVIAFVLNNVLKRGSNVYRALFFLPVVSSTAIIGVVMQFILNPTFGPVNNILSMLNITSSPIDFLGLKKVVLPAIMSVEIWHYTGQYIVYWMAGLQTVPASLYEAADIDGASGFQKFTKITVPVMKPFIVIISFIGIVMSLRVFDIVKTMTNGGPNFASEVIGTFIYKNSFGAITPKYGYSSAVAIIFGILLIVVGMLQAKAYSKSSDERKSY